MAKVKKAEFDSLDSMLEELTAVETAAGQDAKERGTAICCYTKPTVCVQSFPY